MEKGEINEHKNQWTWIWNNTIVNIQNLFKRLHPFNHLRLFRVNSLLVENTRPVLVKSRFLRTLKLNNKKRTQTSTLERQPSRILLQGGHGGVAWFSERLEEGVEVVLVEQQVSPARLVLAEQATLFLLDMFDVTHT